jgi:hypothetical protein
MRFLAYAPDNTPAWQCFHLVFWSWGLARLSMPANGIARHSFDDLHTAERRFCITPRVQDYLYADLYALFENRYSLKIYSKSISLMFCKTEYTTRNILIKAMYCAIISDKVYFNLGQIPVVARFTKIIACAIKSNCDTL